MVIEDLPVRLRARLNDATLSRDKMAGSNLFLLHFARNGDVPGQMFPARGDLL
jgi:hypothetical protein